MEAGAAKGAGPMINPAMVRSGIALVAGAIVAWSFATYGTDAFAAPGINVAAVLAAVFGLDWLR